MAILSGEINNRELGDDIGVWRSSEEIKDRTQIKDRTSSSEIACWKQRRSMTGSPVGEFTGTTPSWEMDDITCAILLC